MRREVAAPVYLRSGWLRLAALRELRKAKAKAGFWVSGTGSAVPGWTTASGCLRLGQHMHNLPLCNAQLVKIIQLLPNEGWSRLTSTIIR